MPKEVVTIEGLPGLKAALERKVEELRAARELVVAEEGRLIEADAKMAAPVDKGELRDGIELELGQGLATIRTTSEHSAANEFGTSKMAAQPFMTPTAERARRRIPKTAAALFRKTLGG